ncbi:hypothetical protein CDL15_Pgr002887 [Punica granatum]|uniref:Uncharacterized protein n=1 Tax=Punica granatum TaxID=22663 RepID=A0A218X1Z0_PUNGR|nr:hypothetical protein CDL15_Pgr002887 [Punica granatum]
MYFTNTNARSVNIFIQITQRKRDHAFQNLTSSSAAASTATSAAAASTAASATTSMPPPTMTAIAAMTTSEYNHGNDSQREYNCAEHKKDST